MKKIKTFNIESRYKAVILLLVVHEHSHLENLSQTLQAYMKTLQADTTIKKCFIPAIFISFLFPKVI